MTTQAQLQLVQDEALSLHHDVQEADTWALDAAHLLDPLDRATGWAKEWSAHPEDPQVRRWLDAVALDLDAVPLGDLPAWEVRLARRAMALVRDTGGAS